MRHSLALLLIIFATQAVAGGVYRWTDEDGNVHFGDRPPRADTEKTDIPRHTEPPRRAPAHNPYSVVEQAARIDARDNAALQRRNAAWARDVADHEMRKAEEKRLRNARIQGEVVPGMGADIVRRMMGTPDTINRSDYGRGWEEQWVYYEPVSGGQTRTSYIYVKGGTVTSVQLR